MKFLRDNCKLCIMKKQKDLSPKCAWKEMLHMQLVLLMMLLFVSRASGQGPVAHPAGSALTKDTILINQYIQASRNGAIPLDSAQALLDKALVLAKRHGLQKKTGMLWNMIGSKMLQRGNFDGCRLYLDSAFALNANLKDGELTCILNTLAAGMYQYSSQYAKAATHYFRALRAVEESKIESPRPVVVLYINLGRLMILLNEDSLGRKYLLLAKQHALHMQPIDSVLLVNTLFNLGQTYVKLDSTASAIHYYKDAYQLAGKLNDIPLSHTILINLMQCYILGDQYDSVEHYLRIAKGFNLPGVPLVKTETVEGLLSLYKKDYGRATLHLQNALQLTHGDEYENLNEIYNALSEVYAAQGQYAKAYAFQKKYADQYKKLMNNPQKTVADFMLNFQALEHEKNIIQKQAEISAREASIKRQRFWIITMCVVSGLLCIILLLAYRNYHHKKSLLNQQMRSLLQEQEIERLKAEAEGEDKERTRIAYDLHDGILVRLAHVKMNLSGFSTSGTDRRYQDVMGQLDIATRELRNTAHNLMPEILLEDGMAQAIFYFCKATEQASGLTIKFQQIGPPLPKLITQAETAVYRIVQGLLQNIIQHAGATMVLVQLQYAEHLCSITVEDNGQGMTTENSEGYGLKSIRNRIKILNGTFDIESEKGHGTTVYFEFDVRRFLQHADIEG